MSQIETVKSDAARVSGRLQELLFNSGLHLKADVEHVDNTYTLIVSEEESGDVICYFTVQGTKEEGEGESR